MDEGGISRRSRPTVVVNHLVHHQESQSRQSIGDYHHADKLKNDNNRLNALSHSVHFYSR